MSLEKQPPITKRKLEKTNSPSLTLRLKQCFFLRLLFLWDPVLLFLGNVLNVVTDRKLPVDIPLIAGTQQGDGIVDYFTGDVVSYSDYLPFGQIMPNRHGYQGTKYRYGFQDQEVDDELKGEDNSVNYTYRMSDPRLGRFFATDPLSDTYPYNSPYAFSENRVIDAIELEGKEAVAASISIRVHILRIPQQKCSNN